MELNQWKTVLIPYQYAVEELKVKFKNIRKELIDNGEYSPIEFVTGRVKKISSIIDKAKRLDIDLSEVDDKIEDIAGIRIMCQFVEDIYTVVSYIRSRKDMDVLYEKDYIKNDKSSGYRSYHVIIKYPIQTVSGVVDILAEIQIRTLSMNFWATIEHSLKYKYNHYIPSDIAQRLRKAADAAFNLDQEMSVIREEIMRAQVMFEMKSVTVKDIIYSIQELQKMGLTDEAKDFQRRFDAVSTVSEMDDIIMLRNELNKRIYELKKS
ncbi:putative GTP pyrophosphokinase [Acetoanaerobium noterae]|jgi:putative GTP pyrophosphokinase|uniref:Putative guanosine 3',5'-bis-pyrophosphate (PpGpp) synthesis/degradation protein n=2 Tax=Acetoanaerobium TaxID=186831 RepID=E3PX80_ACESD|nr:MULTISPECIES: GTP pyrophosphokinase family protein [Acetoanaerobium]MBP8763142.1 GTP pyrophosphokinase family protein [Acetoanaerobium sp.]MDK2804189.1 pyrophosphokinae [Peptostreptococcaceae bacterium]MBP9500152.1 GTP pyrophosphokinase family protein [Acetoanaerobium sp.]MBP9562575.1 GTP pyrophosphokinase family protein [Acetoanaerobium sp.]CBH21045.1 putative guanosine 3',5'-bis-pyrophosphate (PpGpp) synthesis/degradation protein [Acetoanaerobium sticklandii]